MPERTDTFITVDAQGRISADFAGHIKAAGLDLLADVSGTAPPSDRKIQWLRQSNGALIADIDASENGGNGHASWNVRNVANNVKSSVVMEANADGTGSVYAQVAGAVATIIQNDDKSEFFRTPSLGFPGKWTMGLGFASWAHPGGWSSNGFSYNYANIPFPPDLNFPFYYVEGAGASIVGHHAMGHDQFGQTIAINSTVAQIVNVGVVAIVRIP